MALGFLRLPAEIRLMIYEHLLLYRKGPYINACSYVDRTGKEEPLEFSPVILRVNKQIYHEAREVLYGRNRFQLLHHWGTSTPIATALSLAPNVAPFLSQIGHHAALLRHITIMLPILEIYGNLTLPARTHLYNPLKPYEDVTKTFNIISDACTNVKTLELVISQTMHETAHWPPNIRPANDFIEEACPYHWDYLDRLFKRIVSLQEVLVNFRFHESQRDELMALLCESEHQFDEWSERGWKCKGTNLGYTASDVHEVDALYDRAMAFEAWIGHDSDIASYLE